MDADAGTVDWTSPHVLFDSRSIVDFNTDPKAGQLLVSTWAMYWGTLLSFLAGSSLNALDLAGNTPISCRLELCYSHARYYAATTRPFRLSFLLIRLVRFAVTPESVNVNGTIWYRYHTTPHHTIRQVSCTPSTPRSLSWSRSTQRMAQSVPLQPRQTWCSRLMLPRARCEWQRVWPMFTYHVLIERSAIPDLWSFFAVRSFNNAFL